MLSSLESAGGTDRDTSRNEESGISVKSVDVEEAVSQIAKATRLRSKLKRTMRKKILEVIQSDSAVEDEHRHPERKAEDN